MAQRSSEGRSSATRSGAISQYVLKIASRCDLKCDYCYVYEHADQGWRRQPKLIEPATVAAAARRIAEHARAHRLPLARVILHGGEPLLAGAERLAAIATELRRAVEPVSRLDLRMQSNGVLLTQEVCTVLVEHGIKVGISLDGGERAHDRHRRFAHGGGSYREVTRALRVLRAEQNRASYAGLLCTVDLANEPLDVYAALMAQEPPRIDFLLPHATWDNPPYRPAGARTPYAAWLTTIYRRWVADGRPVPIRLFDSLLSLRAGRSSGTEAVGLDAVDLVVVETDGSYEQVDSLKIAYDGAAATGRDVFSSTIDEVAAHPMIAIRQVGLAGLSATCRSCAVVDRCGGGQFAHRFRTGSGFDNPSVYCADLEELIRMTDAHPATTIDEVASWVRDDLAAGPGGADAVGQLAPIHEATVRAQLVRLSEWATAGWDELTDLDDTAPTSVQEVITYPFVRQWATRAVARARAEGSVDVAYLACVAASAAVRAAVEVELAVPIEEGLVKLPTLGTLRWTGDERRAKLRTTGDGFRLVAGSREVTVRLDQPHPDWQPIRQVPLGDAAVLLEDTDPVRTEYAGLSVAGRLSGRDVDDWARRLDGAMASIRADAVDYVDGIAATVRAVVPLRPDPDGRQHSGSARSSFGAVALSPEEPAALALLLIHEVQHLKLGALLDVCAMFDRRDERRLSVPWRADPRPIEGALQGTYAFLALADLWRRRSGAEARQHYRTIRGWTDRVIDDLLGVRDGRPLLTSAGTRFANRMRTALDGW